MKTNSVKGTNDYLPKEAELRDNLQQIILNTYKKNGFNRIYTPIIEDIENLEKSDGGDNLNLIFKILKRGDKFSKAISENKFDDLCDMGLRYDLTLPLTRFYASHRQDLPGVFKVIQMDRVYRAERPQKGRNREFMQCDIDIIGSKSETCEIELIDTTAQALLNLGLKNFTIRINDRKILKTVLLGFGFKKEDLDSVCISFDKVDKIGKDGVCGELLEKGFEKNAVEKLKKLMENMPKELEDVKKLCGDIEEIERMEKIISSIKRLSVDKYRIQFDLSLVRGQSYYTGAVFEIQSDDFSCAIGGGGRYDNLVGKFIGEEVPAVGFSIGFERIFAILSEENNLNFNNKPKLAVIYNTENFVDCCEYAKLVQETYDTTLFEMPKKFGKFLSKLEQQNFSNYIVLSEGNEIKTLNK